MTKRDPLTVERELNAARMGFAVARASLANALVDFGGREGVQDRVINYAEEFGIEHALAGMANDPHVMGLNKPIERSDVPELRDALLKAYGESHRVDRLLAEREALTSEVGRAKAIMVGGREAEFDGVRMRWRDTGAAAEIEVERVSTRDQSFAMDEESDMGM